MHTLLSKFPLRNVKETAELEKFKVFSCQYFFKSILSGTQYCNFGSEILSIQKKRIFILCDRQYTIMIFCLSPSTQ